MYPRFIPPKYLNVNEPCCTSLDIKKPAKPYDLRVFVLLSTSLNPYVGQSGLVLCSVGLYK